MQSDQFQSVFTTSQYAYLLLLVLTSVINSLSMVLVRFGGAISAKGPASQGAAQWLWHSKWWLLGLGASWFCGLAYAWTLRQVPLTIAMPIYAGLVYTLSVGFGCWLLGERMSLQQAIGITVVFLGLLILILPAGRKPVVGTPATTMATKKLTSTGD